MIQSRKALHSVDAEHRRCAYCGEGLTGATVTLDHVIPRSRGGTGKLENLALACQPCNRAKGSMTAEEFGHPEVLTVSVARFMAGEARRVRRASRRIGRGVVRLIQRGRER